MQLSVILPTRNRAALLANALASLQQQTLAADRFEVLVVDSGSSDATRAIVSQIRDKLKNLHYFFCPDPGLHAARHLGMEKARNDLLVYCDDDSEAFPGWLEAVAEGFEQHQAAMVGGKCLPKFEKDPPSWLVKRWTTPGEIGFFVGALSILDCGEVIREIPPTCIIGCNFAIRRQSLLAAGGFHPDSMPAEMLIYRGDGENWVGRAVAAQGGKVLYHPRAAVFHFVPAARMTRDYFYRRNFAEGISRSFVHIRKQHGLDDLPVGEPPLNPDLQRRALCSLKGLAMLLPFHHRLQRSEKKGLRDGYHYHQKMFNSDPQLRTWVLQTDWLGHSRAAERS